MPGSHWSRKEIRSLRKQLREGKGLDSLTVAGRTKKGIRYKVYSLGFRFCLWSAKETKALRRLILDGWKPWEIEMSGRSKRAIRNKSIRCGIWKPKKRVLKSWTIWEIKRLRRLVQDKGYTAKRVVSNGYFPQRSQNSIAQQMRRSGIRRV